jgi:GT2 family glycosyltransferase
MPKLSVIIINYGTKKMTERVLRNFIVQESFLDFEIILIDNKSHEKIDKEIFYEMGVKLIVNNYNEGFARAVNQGLDLARGEYVLLLNSDVLIEKEAISKMIDYMDREKEVCVTGARLNNIDGSFQISFGKFPNLWREFLRLTSLFRYISGSTLNNNTFYKKQDLKNPQEVDWVSGGLMLVRRNEMCKFGALDENYFLGVEDIDLCYRIKKTGGKIIYFPDSWATHYHGFSSGKGGTKAISRIKFDQDGINLFFKKHFPEKKKTKIIINFLHNLKIVMIKLKHMFSKEKKYIPRDATIAITYKCNSRCKMCNIWQKKNPLSLDMKAIRNLSSSLKYLNVSGGEPFMREDLVDVIREIKKNNKKVQIIISSNGYATELIKKRMQEIIKIDPKIGVRISIDGFEEKHDQIRGIKGMYNHAMNTLQVLKKIGVKNLGISFTVMDSNINDLLGVYKWAEKNNLQFAMALVQNSDIYFSKGDNQLTFIKKVSVALNKIVEDELKSFNPKRWGRAYYDYGLKIYAETRKRLLKTGAAKDSLFVDVDSKVYPSNLINEELGNLKEKSLDNIWKSEKAKLIRDKIKDDKITESWIICTIRGEFKRNAFKIIFWILKNKIRLIFGFKIK